MGSVFNQQQEQAKQPSTPPTSYINEIAGYEQVPVTNDDGSITYITRELPLSQEDQLKQSQLQKIADDALAEMQNLTSADYVASASTQKLLDDWEATQQLAVDESFTARTEKEEDRLAKRGLSDSTAGDTVRRQNAQDEYDAEKQIDRQRSSISSSIRQGELNNQQYMYNLAQNQLNYDQAQMLSSSNNNLSSLNAITATNNASINDYYTNRGIASAAPGNSGMFINNILDPLSAQAGETSSGALDAGVDGFVSTITGSFL
tara:strand:- start:5210 stop:5992 length:783 start_codon:yes stop_codon:yes gene_type:complete